MRSQMCSPSAPSLRYKASCTSVNKTLKDWLPEGFLKP